MALIVTVLCVVTENSRRFTICNLHGVRQGDNLDPAILNMTVKRNKPVLRETIKRVQGLITSSKLNVPEITFIVNPAIPVDVSFSEHFLHVAV